MTQINKNRLLVSKLVKTIHLDYTTLADAKQIIDDAIIDYGADARFRSYQEDDGDTQYLGIFAMQLESDREMAQRIKKEEKAADLCEQRDLKEYQRLRNKFG
jgi:transcription initiation factor TFIIIB Brf1 subunit/transcription initiation factor TFIIB